MVILNGNYLVLFYSLPLEAGAMEAAARCIQNGDFQHLADFDNHLDNVALDWRNKDLVDL